MTRYVKEADELKAENKELSELRFQQEKKLTQLGCTIDRLEGEVRDKMTIINSSTQLKETSSNQIKSLEEQGVELKRQISKMESKIEQLEGDVSRLQTTNGELVESLHKQKERNQERK